MFIVGMAMIVAGYTLLYYGESLWQAYRANGRVTTVQTLGYLLGFNANVSTSRPPLPFVETTSGTTGGSNPIPSTPSGGSGSGSGSGVQSV